MALFFLLLWRRKEEDNEIIMSKNILFLTRLYYPHVGGVEKHVSEISKQLAASSWQVTVITERYDNKIKRTEVVDGVSVIRFSYPKVKFFGLISVWFWFLRNLSLIRQSDIVHAHDVGIWYLPFKLMFPGKKFYITFHGWEGKFPVPSRSKFLRKVVAGFSDGVINVGKYLEKYYGVKPNTVIYGGVKKKLLYRYNDQKIKNSIVYLGRLDRSTTLSECLDWLGSQTKKYKVTFCGDGEMRSECESLGKVLGFVDPSKYLAQSEICVPGGYLAAMEGMFSRCKIKVFWNGDISRDIWKMTPYYKWVARGDTKSAYNWVRTQTWDKMTESYLKLWKLKSGTRQ